MEKLIFPGHIAKLDYIMPALQVYVEAGDWVKTADYIEREFAILKANGVESEMKEDKTDYTKDAELPRYFGFVERKIPGDFKSDCRITELGKRFYDAVKNEKQDEINESVMKAFETTTFGKNNDGCPGSNTRLEAPNILLIASLMLDGVSRQEYAGILYEMLYNNAPIVNALAKIKISREKESTIENKVRVDNKIVPFLVNLNFLLEDGIFIKLAPSVKEVYQERITNLPTTNNIEKSYPIKMDNNNFNDKRRQIIFYGAPGTGKSHEIKEKTTGKSVVRTTFHPDSDYSTFVGCYKPSIGTGRVYGAQGPLTEDGKPIEESKITYKYVMQAFLKAYLGAWKKYADRSEDIVEPQFLVIEEINRGNCAQIFGDLFQLLDRGDNYFSEYPIEADTDLQQEIKRAFKENFDYKLENDINVEGKVEDYTSNYGATLSDDIQSGRVLLLPSNLYIWATMNTSDQSLFPIDSAFKRRWDWNYMKIKKGKDENGNELDWRIVLKDNNENIIRINDKDSLSWWDFICKINEIIGSMTSSADKQLGYFFCKADNEGIISSEAFVSKVIFYLWNDVFKDYGFEDTSLFLYKTMVEGKEVTKDLTFPDFYDEEGENINGVRLKGFLESVMNWKKKDEEQK